jgi:hypothetical protein
MTVRFSSELPEDEGTVFVTNVPDAPFQILGRRRDGELFVGSTFIAGPAAPSIDDVCREMCRKVGSIEIITGAEGEKLIRAMVLHLRSRQQLY